MKFAAAIVPAVAVLLATVTKSIPVKRDVDPNLVPQFGWQSGINPTGTGDCDGAVKDASGNPIKVPCDCPPDRDTFIASLNANVNAGHAVHNPSVAVTFPTDGSTASQIARIQASLVTLQNLNGSGSGCPASSTTFLAQQSAIQNGQTVSSVAPAPATSAAAAAPPASSAAASSSSSDTSIAALAPPLGFQSGVNPTGTGDCDGAVKGANGQPIKVPCACPPSQDEYISQLEANVAAGHAVNNPTVAVSFPTDSSPASQAARIVAAIVTIQNLNGPGQGCPAASTTLSSQLAAVQG